MTKPKIIEPAFTKYRPKFPEIPEEDRNDFIVFTGNNILTSNQIHRNEKARKLIQKLKADDNEILIKILNVEIGFFNKETGKLTKMPNIK